MTKKSGVAGKTVEQLSRVEPARKRQKARAERTAEQQLELLQRRPGNSKKETKRLVKALG